jgi:nucleoside-diphosphate-sugar epimerase
MKPIIIVAGGTGNLGSKIIRNLVEMGATIRAIIRLDTTPEKLKQLEDAGAIVCSIDMMDVQQVSNACKDAHCVVSALAGLEEVVLKLQKVLLDGAVLAGVPRFIPSDYSLDFTKFSSGENRNLDWRRTFHTYLDAAPIQSTSIFNGAFADLLKGEMPMILAKQKWILYWGKSEHKMVFTTINDTALYTTFVAMDNNTPRYLTIAGNQLSPKDVCEIVTEITGKEFKLFRAGGLKFLSILIKIARKLAGGENELYPPWQGMQYMRNMIDDRALVHHLDNDRYPKMKWTSVKTMLIEHFKK